MAVRSAQAPRRYDSLAVVAVLMMALALRLWGIDFGLPYAYHPDEPGIINRAVRFFRTGDLNPRWFHYPTLYTYIVAAVYLVCYVLGLWGRGFAQPGEMPAPGWLVMGGGLPEVPEQFLIARLLTAGLGILTVALSYAIASHVWDRKTGSIAALFLTVSSLHVANSQFATTDVPMAFMATLSLAFCVRVAGRGHWRDYLLAGLAAGLAVSTKYNAVPVIASLIVAHSLHSYPDLVDWRLVLAIGATSVGFAVGMPFAFVELGTFWSGIVFEVKHYASGHAGFEGEHTWWWVLRLLVAQEGLLLPLGSLGGLAEVLRRLNREILPLCAFVLLYYGMLAGQVVRFSRNLVPLLPALAVLGAGFVGCVLRWTRSCGFVKLVRAGAAAMIAGSLMVPLTKVIKRDLLLSRKDVRTVAAEWVTSHIPPESRVAGESYAPSLNPSVYDVEYFDRVIDHGPEWYREQGFDYLMVSSGMYGRFYAEAEDYSQQVAQYEEILGGFRQVARFAGPMMGYPGGEVIVLRVVEDERDLRAP
jgi:4-amino-4-deoxy-L-arabinose transferase-like glycosyltransferase